MDFTFGPVTLDDAHVELRPVYDPVLRTFSVQLWKDGEPAGIHGLIEAFPYPDEATEAIDAFLTAHDVRELTGEETVQLYGGLLAAKGGPDYQLFVMQLTHGQAV